MGSGLLILNGPNLNMLGLRQPEIYGRESLADIETACVEHAATRGMTVDFRQSNVEGELVGWIQTARQGFEALIVNAGAYTHTSIAMLDSLMMLEIPVIEVHLSNIYRREAFRHHSYISRAATGVICGFGSHGYILAIDSAASLIARADERRENPQ